MNAAAAQALAAADWKTLAPKLQRDAHNFIARYRWRGLRVTASADGRLAVGNKGPDDFVMEAVAKLVHGPRTYRNDLSLEENIKRTVESDISNHWKKTFRRPQILDRTAAQALDDPGDPLDDIAEEDGSDTPAETTELKRRQNEMLNAFGESLADDDELSLLFLAYGEGKYKPAEIEIVTGIKAVRVSELKRKLSARAEKFLRVRAQFADLRPSKEAS